MTKKELLTYQEFAELELAFRKNFALPIEFADPAGKNIAQFCSSDCHPDFCKMVQGITLGRNRCQKERIRSLKIAFSTGQPYITICHAGIVLACVPAMHRNKKLGGIFFGKCLWEQPDSILFEDINRRLEAMKLNKADIIDAVRKLPVISARKTHEAAEFLFDLLYEIAGLDSKVIQWRRQSSQQQAEISEIIRQQKQQPGAGQYPIEAEKQLMNKVRIGDRTGAKEILNMILASIMLKNPGDLAVLRARMLELLSVLSRSAVEGGVDANFLLEKNLQYMNKAIQINNQQDLCAWIGSALDDFIELVYSAQDSKRVSQIKPAIEYIKAHFNEQITLVDIAKAAHLSVSRLSHIFKEQVGVTIVDYLTNVRIEYAKELLISTNKTCTEVCFESGYNNQSYFTQTFKELVGVTPKQFREINRRRR